MQTGIYAYSDQVKAVKGFKVKSLPPSLLGSLINPILSSFNLHLIPLPMPSYLPVWLKGEIDTNYIILSGVPHSDNKDEVTIIRILDSEDFVIREFEIQTVEEEENYNDDITSHID